MVHTKAASVMKPHCASPQTTITLHQRSMTQ